MRIGVFEIRVNASNSCEVTYEDEHMGIFNDIHEAMHYCNALMRVYYIGYLDGKKEDK